MSPTLEPPNSLLFRTKVKHHKRAVNRKSLSVHVCVSYKVECGIYDVHVA